MTLILQDDHLTARTWAVRSVSGQDASCARAVVSHFAELTVSFFYENVLVMPSFYLKFCYCFDKLVMGLHAVQFCLLSYS